MECIVWILIGLFILYKVSGGRLNEMVSFFIGLPLILIGAALSLLTPLFILMYIGGWRPW
jgi:uncharacterized membrane protein